MNFKLYHYWRSSSSWRVRMGFAFKKIPVEYVAVNLLSNEQTSLEHLKRNPSGLVPCLEVIDGGKSQYLNQSVAILEWLEETHPAPALMPNNAFDRARVRELVQIISADTQPIQNLKVMQHASQDQAERAAWARHWIENGFTAYESAVKKTTGVFSFGDQVTMADLFLVPQFYNAGRFNVDVAAFPTIYRINAALVKLDFCQATAPDRFQP